MSTDTGPGTIPEGLIVLEEAPEDSNGHSSAEELLRDLAAEGNLDAREAIAFLAATRSQRTQQ